MKFDRDKFIEQREQREAEIERDARDRRDRFAAAALTGFAACPKCHENVQYDAAKFAHSAVEFADALIAALDRPKEPQS